MNIKRNFKYGSLFLILLFGVCTNNIKVVKPKNLIDESKMEEILFEATMMQVMNTFSEKNLDFVKILGAPYLYLKHGVDSLQLMESEEYYTKNPRIYHRIYSRVLARMQKEKDSIDKIIKD